MSAKRTRQSSIKVALPVLAVLMVIALCGCSNLAGKAREAEAAGDLKTAISLYQDVLKQNPGNIEATKALAANLYIMGRFDEALPYEEKAVTLDPNDAQTRVELGFNYLSHQGQPLKAVAVMTEATLIDASAKYLTFLAQAQLAAGDQQAAEQALRKALVTDASYGHTYTVLISLLESQGRASEAAQLRAMAKSAGVIVPAGDRQG